MTERVNGRLSKVSYRLAVAKVEPTSRREIARQRPGSWVDVAAFGRAAPKDHFTAPCSRTLILWLYWPIKGCEGVQK